VPRTRVLMGSMHILDTHRLWLRSWDAATDLERACLLWGDPEVMTFLGGVLSRENIQEKLKFEMACQENFGVQYWPIFEKQTEEFVGCCGLRPWVYSPPEGHELGFHLLKAKWGHGYAFEVAQGVVRHAFEKLGLPVLRAGHHPENVNSKKILVKLGFQPVNEVFYKPTGLMHPTYKLVNGKV
jgi:ribosomal-protein-alanine N-acetyltransferase